MSKLLLVAVLLGATGSVRANIPARVCHVVPSHDWGYRWGFYAGALADATCAYRAESGLDRFPVLVMAAGLLQADVRTGSEETAADIPRARLSVTGRLGRRVTLVATGDAAQLTMPDAHLAIDIVSPPRVVMADEDMFALTISAGRQVVPFALEQAWSDANLPFLERTRTMTSLAPRQRQHGVALAARQLRQLEVARERSDTENTLGWHVELGAFQPVDEPESYAMIGRAFVRRDRNNEYRSLDTHLHVGASAAVGRRRADEPAFDVFVPAGNSRQYAVELDARYYRYRASAELVVSSVETRSTIDGTRSELRGHGATLTIAATIPVNRGRWWTEPLHRHPLPSARYVTATDAEPPNPGVELDLGIEAMRVEQGVSSSSTTAVHVGAHAFAHDFAKLSCAYTFIHSAVNRHEATLRLQIAF